MILALILISTAGLAYLTATDPKRRRTHGQHALARRPYGRLARLAAFAPGLILLLIGHWAGLAIWLGAITLVGWGMAAILPAQYAAALAWGQSRTQKGLERLEHGLSGLLVWGRGLRDRIQGLGLMRPRSTPKSAAYIAELESRIAMLEARLHRLEAEQEGQSPPRPPLQAASLI